MLYVCVRGVMDVVFVCIVTCGAVGVNPDIFLKYVE